MPENLVLEIVEHILEKTHGYLKRVMHNKGTIFQMNRLLYKEAREELSKLDF